MKRILSCLLVLALCIGVVPAFAACGGKSDITILLMCNAQEAAFYRTQFKATEEKLGISIKFEDKASGEYYDAVRQAINRGDTPDIIYVRQSDVRRYLDSGLLADISSYLGDYKTQLDRVYTSAKEMYMYNPSTKTWGEGGTYAVPKDLSVQQLGYNRTLIHENRGKIYEEFGTQRNDDDDGIPRNADGTVKMPWEMDWATENYTWEQYLRMAKAINAINGVYGCDLPDIEILTWAFGGTILSSDLQNVQIDSPAFKQAAAFQARLIDEGAASTGGATYENFQSVKNVAFYGLVNSFDIKSFDDSIGAGNWGVMPWPYVEGVSQPTEWQGKITSAGYAVTNACKNKAQAVSVIMELLDDSVQNRLVQTEKLMLPLFTDVAAEFVKPEYDDVYSPESRSVYIDVISGKNGRVSDSYYTYDTDWYNLIATEYTEKIFGAEKGKADSVLLTDAGYTALQKSVQELYDSTKNR